MRVSCENIVSMGVLAVTYRSIARVKCYSAIFDAPRLVCRQLVRVVGSLYFDTSNGKEHQRNMATS